MDVTPASELVATILCSVLGIAITLGGGILLRRYARRTYGGVFSTLPPAKIHDGRVFRGPRREGRDNLRYWFATTYAWILITFGVLGLVVGIFALADHLGAFPYRPPYADESPRPSVLSPAERSNTAPERAARGGASASAAAR